MDPGFQRGTTWVNLTLHDELHNVVYVMQFDSRCLLTAKADLLALSPVKALDTYATINHYHADFDPCNPIDFTRIVTVYIPRGSPRFFQLIDTVVKRIREYIKGCIAIGIQNHFIAALITTKLRFFRPSIKLQSELLF